MGAICVSDPDGIIWQVPEPRPPWTFDEVYGSAGYTLVPDCPPVPETARAVDADEPVMPTALQDIINSERVDNG